MAKKKSHGLLESIGDAIGDVVDAGSVAATGSQLGVLELAAEEEIRPTPSRRKKKKKKAKAARKKKKAVAKSKKKAVVKAKKKAKKQKPKRK